MCKDAYTCKTIDESHKNNVERKKPDPRQLVTYDSKKLKRGRTTLRS